MNTISGNNSVNQIVNNNHNNNQMMNNVNNNKNQGLGFSTEQSEIDKINTKFTVDNINQELRAKKMATKTKLGQSDFLKLLVTQLRFQDPLKPMENKEFIAQMAQFTALEETTQINKGMKTLVGTIQASENYNLLGKRVHYTDEATGSDKIGVIHSITNESTGFKLGVNNDQISSNSINKVELIAPIKDE